MYMLYNTLLTEALQGSLQSKDIDLTSVRVIVDTLIKVYFNLSITQIPVHGSGSIVGAQSSNVSCHQSSAALIYPTKERFNHQGISQSLSCKYGVG